MKIICQILWEKEPFEIISIFFTVHAIKSTFLSDSFETCIVNLYHDRRQPF